jgi:pyridoxal phosphate enzyme (YggS family)
MDYAGLPGRVQCVRETIARHQAVGGWSHPVEIVAVTKTHGSEAARAAFEAGLTAIGENRVQEALAKQPDVADLSIQWHLIGPLQRNKVKHVIGRFALVHTVDRVELVEEFSRRLPPGQRQRVLVEVNCSGESQKAGVLPEELPALLESLAGHAGMQVEGLMTMAPFTEDVEVQRSAFRRLRTLREEAERRGWRLPHLSMGMSGDFPTAVEEGATIVRLGTILFGERSR